MAPVIEVVVERRHERRCAGAGTQWKHDAVLRPGQHVILVNISSRAALVEAGGRLRPGAQTELQLAGAESRVNVRGRLERCHVASLRPMRYRGLLVFDQRLDLG